MDQPIVLGIRTEVVVPGAYATGLVIEPGAARADVLPLDTIELQWVTAFPATPQPQSPVWLACPQLGGTCDGIDGPDLEACPVPLPLVRTEPCRLGVGERLQVVLADVGVAPVAYEQIARLQFLAIGSGSAEVDPETCLARLRATTYAGLEACLIGRRTISLGPPWHLWSLLPSNVELPVTPAEIPEEALAEPPNVHPQLAALRVQRTSAGGTDELDIADGDTVVVTAGGAVRVQFELAESTLQEFRRPPTAQSGMTAAEVEVTTEYIRVDAYLTFAAEDFVADNDGVVGWTVPPGAPPFRLYLWIRDPRGGSRPITVNFTPTGPP